MFVFVRFCWHVSEIGASAIFGNMLSSLIFWILSLTFPSCSVLSCKYNANFVS